MLGHRLMGCTARGFPSRWIQLRMSLVPAPAATAPPAATGTRRASLAFGSVQGAPVTLQHMAIQPVLCLTGIAAGLLSRAWSTEEVKRCTDHIQVHLDVHCTHVYYYDIQYSLFSMFRNQGENFGKHRGSCSHTCSTIITDRGLACVIISDLVPFLRPSSWVSQPSPQQCFQPSKKGPTRRLNWEQWEQRVGTRGWEEQWASKGLNFCGAQAALALKLEIDTAQYENRKLHRKHHTQSASCVPHRVWSKSVVRVFWSLHLYKDEEGFSDSSDEDEGGKEGKDGKNRKDWYEMTCISWALRKTCCSKVQTAGAGMQTLHLKWNVQLRKANE